MLTARIYSRSRFLLPGTTKHIIHHGMHSESPLALQQALKKLKDIAVTPEQPERYKEAVKIYNPAYSYEHPGFVVFPENIDDIKRSLRVANETGKSRSAVSCAFLFFINY